MNKSILNFLVLGLIIILCILFAGEVAAQCPMCRMSAESNLQNGGTEGKGLNTGILYIFVMPYIMVAVMIFLWWRNRNTNQIDME